MSTSAVTVATGPLPLAPCHRRAVERVISELSERLDEHFSLQDMASLAYLSPYHFHRVFRQATGVPPGRFLAALRMEAAKRLLLTSDLSVTEISLAVGYHSLGTFTSQFTRFVGLSPRGLRSLTQRDGVFPVLSAPLTQAGVAVVEGSLLAPAGFHGLAFLGFFPSPLPEGRPAGCAVAAAPGPYRLVSSAEGAFYLLAAALPAGAKALSYLISDDAALIGRSAHPMLVRAGTTINRIDVYLDRRRLIDPPLLLAPTALFAPASGNGAHPNGNGQRQS